MSSPPQVAVPPASPDHDRLRPTRLAAISDAAIRSLFPIVLALVACGLLLLALGRDPLEFYGDVLKAGLLRPAGLQDTITRMAPVLLIAAGLIIAFRANLWNLGSDGQFLLAAAIVAGAGPTVLAAVPAPFGWVLLCAIAMGVGAAWTLIPALLKAHFALNEIITTLMMTFIGIGLANLLVKGPFQGPTTIPQTTVIPTELLLPVIPGTRVHVGIIVALLAIGLVYLVFARTSFGLRLDVLGASPRAASHLGLNVPRLIVAAFLISGALIGLGAAVEILGVYGYMRADWNPAYGLAVIPLVFLARLNPLAVVPFAAFFAVISIGGEYATRQADLPSDFLLLVIGLVLIFMVITQYFSDKRDRGESIMPKTRWTVVRDV